MVSAGKGVSLCRAGLPMGTWTPLSDSHSLPETLLRMMQAVEFAVLALTARCFSQDVEFRIQAESMKRIVWDTEMRCFLDAAAVAV